MVGLFMLGFLAESLISFSFFNSRNMCDEVNYAALMCLAATTSQERQTRQTRAQQRSVTLRARDVFLSVITLFVAPSGTNETKPLWAFFSWFPQRLCVLRRGSQDPTFHSGRSRPPHNAVTPFH